MSEERKENGRLHRTRVKIKGGGGGTWHLERRVLSGSQDSLALSDIRQQKVHLGRQGIQRMRGGVSSGRESEGNE